MKTLVKPLLLLLTVALIAAREVSDMQNEREALAAERVAMQPSPTAPPPLTRLVIQTPHRASSSATALNQTLFDETFVAGAAALLDREQGDMEYRAWKLAEYCVGVPPRDDATSVCDVAHHTTTAIESLARLERAALFGSDQALHHFVDSAAAGTPDYSNRVKNLLLSAAAQGRTTALVLLAQFLASECARSSIVAAISVEYAATVNRQWGSMSADGPTIATGWTFSECFDGVQQGYLLASSLFPDRSSPPELLDVVRICTPPTLR